MNLKVFVIENTNVKVHVTVVQLTLKINMIIDHSFFWHSPHYFRSMWPLPLIKILFSLLISVGLTNTVLGLYKGS